MSIIESDSRSVWKCWLKMGGYQKKFKLKHFFFEKRKAKMSDFNPKLQIDV